MSEAKMESQGSQKLKQRPLLQSQFLTGPRVQPWQVTDLVSQADPALSSLFPCSPSSSLIERFRCFECLSSMFSLTK